MIIITVHKLQCLICVLLTNDLNLGKFVYIQLGFLDNGTVFFVALLQWLCTLDFKFDI